MLFLSTLWFSIALLAVIPAPAKPLWYVAVVATEWGHYLFIASALISLWMWQGGHGRRLSLALMGTATLLFATPWIRAQSVARDLPKQLNRVFGPTFVHSVEGAPSLSAPLRFMTLFRGASSPEVLVSRLEYSRVGDQALNLDLYRPKELGAPLPGLIVIHGGSWQSGDRNELPAINRYLAARGYIVASIDYRLAPHATFPAPLEDVRAAIAYLKGHARELRLDRERLALLGRSAGGQIALSAAYSRTDPAIKSVIAFYTPNDLVWAYSVPSNPLIMNSQRVIETYLGGTLSEKPSVYEAASPLLHVNAQTPPTLMIHGERDELVWAQHDHRLSRRLSEANRPFIYLRMPWATHGCDANFNGPCGQLSTYAIEHFLAATLYQTPEERMAHRYGTLRDRS